MKSTCKSFVIACAVITPFLGSLPGCSQADNPQIPAAAPPPAPKQEELQVPKSSAGKEQYGANTKYQKAMERLNKAGGQ
jgi:hypothetical protein